MKHLEVSTAYIINHIRRKKKISSCSNLECCEVQLSLKCFVITNLGKMSNYTSTGEIRMSNQHCRLQLNQAIASKYLQLFYAHNQARIRPTNRSNRKKKKIRHSVCTLINSEGNILRLPSSKALKTGIHRYRQVSMFSFKSIHREVRFLFFRLSTHCLTRILHKQS